MCELYIPFVIPMNKYEMPKKAHFAYYFSLLPKRKQFFNYIKKTKDLNDEEKQYIAKYFEVGIKDANEYINILSEQDIEEILSVYRYGINKMVEL